MVYLYKPGHASDILFCVVDSDLDAFTGYWMTLGTTPPIVLAGGPEKIDKVKVASWTRFISVEEAVKERRREREQQRANSNN